MTDREMADPRRPSAEIASELLASVAHELKTPLTAISVAVANLRGELAAFDRQEQSDTATTELLRLDRLIDDVLALSRVRTDEIRLEPEWIAPADLVDAAIAYARDALRDRPLKINAVRNQTIHVDGRLMAKALSRLLEHAARCSGQTNDIAVNAVIVDQGLTVAVTYRGLDLDSKPSMNLALVGGLVEALGGRISTGNSFSAIRRSIWVPALVGAPT